MTAAEAGQPVAEAAPWRVLVVDDDAVDRLAVRRGLLRSGAAAVVDEVGDAHGAIDAVARGGYDCVFLDYNIPGGDGLTLLRGIRQAGLEVPVVMLTGQGDEQVAVALMKAGAVDYLPKAAATPERLASSLRYALELSRAAAERQAAQEALRESAERARFLAEASAQLGGSLDVETSLRRLADLAVPAVADACLAVLLDDGAGRDVVAVCARRDPAAADAAAEAARRFRLDRNHPTAGLAAALRDGRPVLREQIRPEEVDALASTPEAAALYRALDAASALFVPLVARGRVSGAVAFWRERARPGFSPADVDFAEDLALRAAAAIDNARLFADAERARARTERLQDVTASLAAALPRNEVARLFVGLVREALGAETAWLSLRDAATGELVAVADAGFEPDQIARFARLPADAPFPSSDIMRDGQGRWFASRAELLAAYPALVPLMGDIAQEAVALLPVALAGRPTGVMTVGFRSPRTFGEDDRALVAALAGQCALALERARLYEAERLVRAEAEAARREAEEANRTKSEFLARMSHDLRTPLNAIGGYAQLIEMGVHGPVTDAQRQSLGRVRRAQEHLLTLINDILGFARLEAGQVRVQLAPVAVRGLVEEIESLVRPEAESRGLALEVDHGGEELVVQADRGRLMQVLLNLTTNALKFTPAGTVRIAAVPAAGAVELRVQDTGRGVPADRLEMIFDPFAQARGAEDEQRGGVGLGLAISRELARLMGGDLTVESREGHGSTFTVRLGRG